MAVVFERSAPRVQAGTCPDCGARLFFEVGLGGEVWRICLACAWQRPIRAATSSLEENADLLRALRGDVRVRESLRRRKRH